MTTLALDGVSGSLYTGSDSYADQNSSTPNWYFAEDYSVVSATGSFTPTLAQLVAASGVSANSTTGSISTTQNLQSEISGVFGSFSTGAEVARPTYTRLLNGNSISNAVDNLSFFSTASSSISGVSAIGYNGPNTYSDITYFAENYVAAEIATDQNYIRSISGITGNGFVGTATGSTSVTIALSSTSVAATVGSITTSSIASSGIAGSSITGIVGPTLNTSSLTRSLAGTNNSVAAGFVATTSAVILAINGNIGTFSTGIETSASSVSISLSGNASIVNSGNIASNSSLSRAVTGLVNTTTVGFITNSASVSVPLIGKTSSISVSSISSTSTSTVALTGSRSTSSIENIGTAAAVSRSITGNIATFSTGVETNITAVSVHLVGTQSSFIVGQDYVDPTYFAEGYIGAVLTATSVNIFILGSVVTNTNTGSVTSAQQQNAALSGNIATFFTGVESSSSNVSLGLTSVSSASQFGSIACTSSLGRDLSGNAATFSNNSVQKFVSVDVGIIGNYGRLTTGNENYVIDYFGEEYTELLSSITAFPVVTFTISGTQSVIGVSAIGTSSTVVVPVFGVSTVISTGIETISQQITKTLVGNVATGSVSPDEYAIDYFSEIYVGSRVTTGQDLVRVITGVISAAGIESVTTHQELTRVVTQDNTIQSLTGTITLSQQLSRVLLGFVSATSVGTVQKTIEYSLIGLSSGLTTSTISTSAAVDISLLGNVAAGDVGTKYAIDYFGDDYTKTAIETSQQLERAVSGNHSAFSIGSSNVTQQLARPLSDIQITPHIGSVTSSSVVTIGLQGVTGTGRVYIVRSDQSYTYPLLGKVSNSAVGSVDFINSNNIELSISGNVSVGHVSTPNYTQDYARSITGVETIPHVYYITPAAPGVPNESGLAALVMLSSPIPTVEDSAVIFDSKPDSFRFYPVRDTIDSFNFTGRLVHSDPSAIVNIIKSTTDPKIGSIKTSFSGDQITVSGNVVGSFADSFYEFAMPNGTLQKLDPGNPGVFYSIVHYSADMHRYIEITYNLVVEITLNSVTLTYNIQLHQTVNNDWDAGRATLKQLSLEGQG